MTDHDLDWSDVERDAREGGEGCEYNDEPDYGGDYPIGEMLACYECEPKTDRDADGYPCVMRKCTARGPVVNPADPTQSYQLECGHLSI